MTEPMQEERPWGWMIARWQRQIAKTDPFVASPEERRVFYEELLLKIHWLAPRIRRAVTEELGLSIQDHRFLKLLRGQFRTDIIKGRIQAHTERLKPSGLSYHDRRKAALAKVADEDDVSVFKVKKELERNSDAKWTEKMQLERNKIERNKKRQK
jgi:hypothetical protein